MADPFPKVAGGGLAILRDAGLDVAVGVCEAEARRLNAPYLKLVGTGRPWVIAKWAMTLDGRIATRTGDSKWISGEESRKRVHELRGRVDAVLVGSWTVIADDPLLTARPPGPRTASRVVVSASGILPTRCQLRTTAREVPVIVFTAVGNGDKLRDWADSGAEVVELPVDGGLLSVEAVLTDLGRRRMTNVLVEGGAGVLGSFLDARAIDEAWVFVAPKLIGGGGAPSPVEGRGARRIAEALRAAETTVEQVGEDVLLTARLS
jgi:diaminohydroxyphosphoribosylaminopyrimidine deaminase/5-amino-6-(5-phosphoribosylamino)uracil reductase